LKEATGGKGLDGVDGKRPFGAYALWPDPADGVAALNFPVVAFVPVADEKRFLDLLRKLKCDPKKDGTLYRLSVPDGPGLFLRFDHRYAFVSTRAATLQNRPPDPATLLPPGGQQGVLTARLLVERFPKKGAHQLIDALLEPLAREFNQAIGDAKKLPGE